MDLVILIIFLLIIVLVFKQFSSFIYFTVIIDLFLKTIHLIGYYLGIAEINNFIYRYIPASIPAILEKYSTGIFFTILMWGYIIIYIIFEFYIIKTFIKKR